MHWLQLSAVFNEHQKCPVCQDILQRRYLVIELSPFDFKYCVILIYRLKVNDMQVTFDFHTNCGGSVSMKSVNGDITNILLAPIIVLGHRGFIFILPVFDSCGE